MNQTHSSHEMEQVFISYSHADADWVRQTLVPVLRGSGISVSIDTERFCAGERVPTQMVDAIVDASTVLLVITDSYLAKENCRFEMDTALSRRQQDSHLRI